MSLLRNVNIENFNLDAFARLRVANPQTIFDSKQLHDNQPLFWDDQQVSGSGTTSTYNTNQASTTIAVSNATAGRRVRQTFRHFNYQPGKSQLIIMTAILGTAGTGITKRIGQYNDKNGVYFQLDSNGLAVGVRTYTSGSSVDTTIPQSSWTIDKLNGTGASGITLDTTKTLIYFIDYEWLGVGTIRYGFFIDGVPYYCHAIHNSNINTVVYMSIPNLPLRYEIVNSGAGTASSLTHICTTVITEGGREDTGFPFGLNRGTSTLITNNDANIYPLIGIRLKANNLSAFIKLLSFTINCTSTATYAYYLILNPTITGTVLTWTGLTNSSVEYAFGTNATTLSSGTILLSDINTDTATIQSSLKGVLDSDFALGSNIAETPQQLFVGIQRLTGTTETFYASLNFRETV